MSKKEWCQERHEPVNDKSVSGWASDKMPKPRRLRCPKCKKRFKTVVWACSDSYTKHDGTKRYCVHEYLPKHKKKMAL